MAKELTIGYKEFLDVLSYCNQCLNDRVIQEKDKKLMFQWDGNEIKVVAYTPTLSTRLKVESAQGGTEDEWFFNLKSSTLTDILSAYTNMFKTYVEKVVLSGMDNDRVILSLWEEPLNEEDADLAQVSHYTIQGQKVPDVILKEVNKDLPEDGWLYIEGNLLSLYLESIGAVISNDSSGSVSRNIFVGEEHVFAIGEATKHVFKNGLPSEMVSITLPYNTVSYLKKVITGGEGYEVLREGGYVHFRYNGIVVSVREKRVTTSVDKDIINYDEVDYLRVNRLYLKDVLKRATVGGKEATIEVTADGVEITSGDFEQVVPAEVSENLKGVRFMVSIPILSKCLIGSDTEYSEDLYMYFVQMGNIWKLYITDETKVWFSLMSVRGVR